MANYSFVINSQFKPFSYAELLAPVHASTEAHQKVEDEYTALSSQAETLRARAEQEALTNPDSKWIKKYNDYAAKLEASASDLAQYGLQPGVRQQIMQAKKDYFNSVDPAVKAIAQQQKLSDMQYSQNPALRMVYGDMPTIDALIGDMTLKPVSYSGQDVYTQAMTSSKAASARNVVNEFMKDPQFAGYIRQVKAAGYDAKTIDDMLKIPELKGVVDMVKNQFGGFDGVSENNQKKLEGEVLKGLFDGVSYTKDQAITYDQYAAQQRQFAFQAAEAEKARQFQKEQAEKARQLELMKAGLIDGNGRPKAGVPGETIPMHFTDKGSAGQAMKEKAAKQTAEYLKYRIAHKKDADAIRIKNYWETHGDKKKPWYEKAIAHWTTNGFNGSYLQDANSNWTSLGLGLRGHLRKNLTDNENIVNDWTSPFVVGTYKDGKRQMGNGPLGVSGKSITKDVRQEKHKNWGNWDANSVSAYTVNAVGLMDKPEQLKVYLSRVLDRNMSDGNVKLFDLKGIDTKGNYTYGTTGTKRADLPTTSSGELDYSKIHRAMLSDGNFMLYWEKDGKTVRKVLKRSDISREAQQEWATTSAAERAALNKYIAGDLTKTEYEDFLSSLGTNHLYNTYSLGQSVTVKDYEVQ